MTDVCKKMRFVVLHIMIELMKCKIMYRMLGDTSAVPIRHAVSRRSKQFDDGRVDVDMVTVS